MCGACETGPQPSNRAKPRLPERDVDAVRPYDDPASNYRVDYVVVAAVEPEVRYLSCGDPPAPGPAFVALPLEVASGDKLFPTEIVI